ncbi:hypothetical protein Acy02nite_49140 [Actinoplanes cyaneus]|uniref:HhH-GPD domain-containing protein n=1 Tax=Actinoplanes cyaneus TaxID=52696 RepID=A0A919IPA0_9ACTN|nr:hypothetical protein [Actinoplanes cyaneus]MCW2140973.1 putative HhH-GPD family protein [Actinoplanes cyaneus]GID67033.1 hypothetical protein Acy02nite_49140 [Actinoplanes cyaneus]
MTTDSRLPIEPITDPRTAFAFLLGVLFNQRMRADQAWPAPHRLAERIRGIAPAHVLALGPDAFAGRFGAAPAIHPFRRTMASRAYAAAELVAARYDGDARRIWAGASAEEFVRRLHEFEGVGERKALVALFVITRQLGIRLAGTAAGYSIRGCGKLAELFHPHHEPLLT